MNRIAALALLLIAPVCARAAFQTTSPSLAAPVSQQEQNKAIARRVFEEIFNQGKLQVANEIYAPDFVNHGMHTDASLETDQAAVRWEKQAFPDLTMTVGPTVAEGDLVSVLWTARGTNTGAAGWLPATGARIELRGITIWRISDGKIREEWTSFDQMRVVRQIAAQLKWELLGLLCVVVILLAVVLWMVGRVARQLLFRRRAA